MKKIEAIIKPFKLDDVREALQKNGVQGLTVTEVKGFGQQKGQTELYSDIDNDDALDFLPKIKIEVIIRDNQLDSIIKIIQNSARSGKIGDGKIFIYDIQEVVRIRTGETGHYAL